MKKILISPDFGAGWSSWNDGEVGRYMLTYQPIIDFLEAGNSFAYEDCHGKDIGGKATHPLLIQLQKECMEKFEVDHVCVLGAEDLVVTEVSGLYRIKEYDGSESIEFANSIGWEVAD